MLILYKLGGSSWDHNCKRSLGSKVTNTLSPYLFFTRNHTLDPLIVSPHVADYRRARSLASLGVGKIPCLSSKTTCWRASLRLYSMFFIFGKKTVRLRAPPSFTPHSSSPTIRQWWHHSPFSSLIFATAVTRYHPTFLISDA